VHITYICRIREAGDYGGWNWGFRYDEEVGVGEAHAHAGRENEGGDVHSEYI
jgi:hypothetical protein